LGELSKRGRAVAVVTMVVAVFAATAVLAVLLRLLLPMPSGPVTAIVVFHVLSSVVLRVSGAAVVAARSLGTGRFFLVGDGVHVRNEEDRVKERRRGGFGRDEWVGG
jgi:hypothetical protein